MTTAENPQAGQGMVVLDIGGDVGALVVSTPAAMAGLEIEICPAGTRYERPNEGEGWWAGEWRSHAHGPDGHTHGADSHTHRHDDDPAWPHVSVLAREAPAGPQYAAVFPGLRDGRYEVWVRPDDPTALTVHVVGGEVRTVTWPAG